MGFLDNITKTINHGVERAKFEAEKFQRTAKLQSDISNLNRQIDAKRAELGDRALELYKAGQIQSPTLGEMIKQLEDLRAQITLREEELKTVQSEVFVEPAPAPAPTQTSAPSQTPPAATAPTPPSPTPPAGTVSVAKSCPNCQFQMPATAMYCPNCGARQGV